MIDVGAFSTRPGAEQVSQSEEMKRLRKALTVVRKELPDVVISVDTFRPEVAQMCVEEYGADIINDVSEGGLTGVANVPLEPETGELPEIFHTVARLACLTSSCRYNLHCAKCCWDLPERCRNCARWVLKTSS